MKKGELWRPIPGFEGEYEVSESGIIRSLTRVVWRPKYGRNQIYKGQIIKPSIVNGYPRVAIGTVGKRRALLVHRIVGFAWVENPDPDLYDVVNHKDGDKLNPHRTNLVWTNHYGNHVHAVENGLTKKDLRKLSEEDVREIRNMYNSGLFTIEEIHSLHEIVTLNTIKDILAWKTWKHLVLFSDLKLITHK